MNTDSIVERLSKLRNLHPSASATNEQNREGDQSPDQGEPREPAAIEVALTASDTSLTVNTGTVGAKYKKQMRSPTWPDYRRVLQILEKEPALRTFMAVKDHPIETSSGEKVFLPKVVVEIVNALNRDGKQARGVRKQEILNLSAKFLLKNSAASAPPKEPFSVATHPIAVLNASDDERLLAIEISPSTPAPHFDANDLLTDDERRELKVCENTIERGWKSVIEACLALRAIRDKRLYREEFRTLEEYCQRRWILKRSTAYQRIEFANTHDALSAMADISQPTNERQVRALAGLSPTDKQRVWREAVQQKAGGNPSHKDVKEVRMRLIPVAPSQRRVTAKTVKTSTTNSTPGSQTPADDQEAAGKPAAYKRPPDLDKIQQIAREALDFVEVQARKLCENEQDLFWMEIEARLKARSGLEE